MKLVPVAVTRNLVTAELLHSRLLAEGFHPIKPHWKSLVTHGGGEDCLRIEVPASEAPAAMEVLRDAGFDEVVPSG